MALNIPETTEVVIVEDRVIASRHLSQQFFQMAAELKREFQCPVCLWQPCADVLQYSFVIRLCGHTDMQYLRANKFFRRRIQMPRLSVTIVK